jgi:hypothetical protein
MTNFAAHRDDVCAIRKQDSPSLTCDAAVDPECSGCHKLFEVIVSQVFICDTGINPSLYTARESVVYSLALQLPVAEMPDRPNLHMTRTQPVFSCHDHVGSNFHLVFAYIQDFGRDLSVPLH